MFDYSANARAVVGRRPRFLDALSSAPTTTPIIIVDSQGNATLLTIRKYENGRNIPSVAA
jgi:hypothetical protein